MDLNSDTNNYDFTICPVDTDSISFCKHDGSEFTQEERVRLLAELNSISPEFMIWEDDGLYTKIIALKAKNYVLFTPDAENPKDVIKTKGSGLRDQKRAIAFREFLNKIVEAMIYDRTNYAEIYNQYVKEIMNVSDIKRFCVKKSFTEKVETSERTNETKVKDALDGTDYRVGDKIYMFYRNDETMCVAEKFDGDYNKTRLLKNLFDSTKIFANVIDIKSTFVNYSLKGNQAKLKELL